jgi:hypothetical protein
MQPYTLVVGTPGVNLTKALKKLHKELGGGQVCYRDIEEEIKRNPKTKQALQEVGVPTVPPLDMYDITSNLPRTKVRELWKAAVSELLPQLKEEAEENSPKVVALAGHMVYFSDKRNEIYGAISPQDLIYEVEDEEGRRTELLKPDKVVLLVDDVFDMYTRLAPKGRLYSSDAERIMPYILRVLREKDIEPFNLTDSALASITAGALLRDILHLLSWRCMETVMAENLATIFGAGFLHWGVKQAQGSLLLWLRGEYRSTVYLSHRISEVRRQQEGEGTWPTFCEEVNDVQDRMCDNGITLVSPSAIDELRFEVDRDSGHYTGTLSPRWPLRRQGAMLYEKPHSAADADYTDILFPRWGWDAKGRKPPTLVALDDPLPLRQRLGSEAIDAFVTVLAREVERQVGARDFLILTHSDGVLVYRPYFPGEGVTTFSGGVGAEVELWEQIASLARPSRTHIAFVHIRSDITAMFKALGDEALGLSLARGVVKVLAQSGVPVPPDLVHAILLPGRDVQEAEGLLSKAKIDHAVKQKLRGMLPQKLREARVEVVKVYLTGKFDVPEDVCGRWVAGDSQELEASWADIASFLSSGQPRGNDWAGRVDDLLPPHPMEVSECG